MKHRYLQHLVKGLGEERGFRAFIEEDVLEGGGRIDVALVRPDFRIACEVTVTTGSDQELRNVEKCLAAKFDHVIVLADEQRHLTAIKKAISRNLEEAKLSRVSFCLGPDIAAILDNLSVGQPTEELVRGYKVRTTRTVVDPVNSETRKRAIANVLTRSVRDLRIRARRNSAAPSSTASPCCHVVVDLRLEGARPSPILRAKAERSLAYAGATIG